jgi:hypothetical protein
MRAAILAAALTVTAPDAGSNDVPLLWLNVSVPTRVNATLSQLPDGGHVFRVANSRAVTVLMPDGGVCR